MSNEFLFFSSVLVQNIIYVIYINSVFEYKYDRWKTNIFLYIVLTFFYVATIPIINLKVLKLFIVICAQTFVFKIVSFNTWKETIKKSLIFVALVLLSELILDIIYFGIAYANHSRLDIDTASTFDTMRVLNGSLALPIIMTIMLIYLIYYHKIKGPIKKKLIFMLILIPSTMAFIHYILYSYNIKTFTKTTLLFIFISSLLFTILSISIYRLIMQVDGYIRKEQELEFLKEKEKLQLEYYKIMQEKENEIRKINHDIKNNLQVIYTLKNEHETKQLMEKITSNLKKQELIKYSKNDILNIILNTKVNEAKKKKIEIDVELNYSIEFMEELDISNLFSNILDNAIENAKGEKIILKVYKKMNYIVIMCKNSFDGELKQNDNQEFMTKKGKNHGYGMKIIDDIINKYHGEKEIYYDKSYFTLTIMIPIAEN